MISRIGIILLAIALTTSCQNHSNKAASESTSMTGVDTGKFIGSWVQPNPINEKEVQGFTLKQDGTAESINMATLKYKRWWYESDTLNLVVESIGNGVSITETVPYEVAKITDKELELKRGQHTDMYKKQ